MYLKIGIMTMLQTDPDPKAVPQGWHKISRSPIFKKLLILSFGTILTFLLLEILVRLHPPFETRIKGDKLVLPVNRTYLIKNNEIPDIDPLVTHTRNSLGFRGSPPPPNDLENYLSIVTIGGSTTECNLLSDSKTWTDILGKKLDRSFKKVWINNAGLDGHSTFGHIVLMEDYVSRLKPKIAIFLVGANELGVDEPTESDNKNIRKFSLNHIKLWPRQIVMHSEFFITVLNLYRMIKARNLGLPHHYTDFKTIQLKNMSEAETLRAILENAGELRLRNYRNRLLRLTDICRANSIEPVLVTQPVLSGRGKDDISGADLERMTVRDLNGKVAWQILELYNDVLRDVAKKNKIQLIDLSVEMPKSSRYFYDVYHFTNSGAEKVADIILKHISVFLAGKYPGFLR